MNMDTPGRSEDWQIRNYTLDEAVARTGLPCVLKVRQSRGQGIVSYGKTVVRIEQWKTLQCVRMKLVQPFDREHLPRHDDEEEFLVPLEYKGQVRLPGTSGGKKYTTVSEVIEDLPNYIHLDNEVVAMVLGTNEYKFLFPGSVLQIISLHPRNEDELICSWENWKFLFKSNFAISCTSLSGTAVTTLHDAVENFPLPKYLQFVRQENIVAEQVGGSNDMSSRVYTENVVAKEVEIKRVLVGVKRKIGGENELIIIPDESGNMFETVQVPKNWSPAVLRDLTMQYFPNLNFEECLTDTQRKLYILNALKQKSTGLQRSTSECPTQLAQNTGAHKRQPSLDSIDGEAKTGKEKVKEYLLMVAKRSKAGFDKVHLEIKHFLKSKVKTQSEEHVYDDIDEINLPAGTQEPNNMETRKFQTVPVSTLRTGDKRTPLQGSAVFGSSTPFKPQGISQQSSYQPESITNPIRSDTNENGSKSIYSKTHSVPSSTDIKKPARPPPPLTLGVAKKQPLPLPQQKVLSPDQTTTTQAFPLDQQKKATQSPTKDNQRCTKEALPSYKPPVARKPSPLVHQKASPVQHSVTPNQNKTASKQQYSQQEKYHEHSPNPLQIMPKPSRSNQQKITGSNISSYQQEESTQQVPPVSHHYVELEAENIEFSSLSVEEVVKLYHDCRMAEFAQVCDERTLDGHFLNQLTDEELEKDPFNLSRFQVIKVKKVMRGWKPKFNIQ